MVSEIFRERVDHVLILSVKNLVLFAGIAAFVFLVGAGLARLAEGWGLAPWVVQAVAFLGYLTYIEIKMRRNPCTPSTRESVEDLVARARTGDLLMFRSYHSTDGVEVALFRQLVAWLSDAFYSHIGMVVERGGQKYLFESVEFPKKSVLLRGTAEQPAKKSGVVLVPLEDALRRYAGRVRLYASEGLRAHVDPEALWHYVQKTKIQPFAPGGPSCVELVRDALWTQGLLKSWPLICVPGWFADERQYTVPVTFERYTVDNGWAE